MTLSFPGTIAGLPKVASQHELVHSCRDHQTPPLKLLWSAYMDFRPQQVLFEKAIAVLMGEASSIGQGHFRKLKLILANPDKPAFARIAFGSCGSFSQDTKDCHLDLSCLAKVQVGATPAP